MEPAVIKQTSEEQKEIRKRVLSLLVKKESYKQKEIEYKQEAQEVNHIVKMYLQKNGTSKGLIETKQDKINLTVVEPKTIIWDVEKLSKRIDKETRDKIIEKQVTIINYGAIVRLLKSYGVPAKEFTQYLDIKKEVNETAIDSLFDLGKLSKEQVKGCYTIKRGTEYVKLTKSQKKE